MVNPIVVPKADTGSPQALYAYVNLAA